MKRKEITMTISEFINYTDQNKLERFLVNKSARNLIVSGLAVALMLTSVQANALDVNTSGIDKLGNTFLVLLQKGGYWICLVMGIKDIISQLMKGGDNINDVGKVIVKYVLAFGSLYMLPYLFDLASECFKR
ncbi:hypothetical protein [Clostridium chrysemydis]|uniref:hypothetical protein n=1 Tax=Clostridium chrysemydis TaxID=2665504 RepID=UPI00188318FC|nr:hypothetical protein [Clostridium chrysemydis]